jgi:guanylate kinase
VLFGPGGAGKGTVASSLIYEVPDLRLSRSWTTRPRRPAERDDAYVFVDRPTFEAQAEAGAFFEWAEFLGNLYGTPMPDPQARGDILLEIDVQGARQVRRQRPDATLILLAAPTPEVQRERMRSRGDDEAHVEERLRAGAEEERAGREIADAVVVNHEVAQATREVAGIVVSRRSAARGADPDPEPATGIPKPGRNGAKPTPHRPEGP